MEQSFNDLSTADATKICNDMSKEVSIEEGYEVKDFYFSEFLEMEKSLHHYRKENKMPCLSATY